ncbi:hypothetical protein DXB41_06245 [Segatella copri]|nr:hypothetical protein DXB41_06245 [Segatella copri]
MTYKWTKLANQNPTEFKYVSLIGVGGKWNEGDDIDLKQVAPHNWYLAKQEIPAGGLKIRADHKWRDDGTGVLLKVRNMRVRVLLSLLVAAATFLFLQVHIISTLMISQVLMPSLK